MSPSAYLLFYRRRSDRPLGGKILEQITVDSRRDIENELRSDSDSDFDSEKETSSTTGEARRLGDFSRNGSPSASAGAGAAHRAGDGGVQAEAADDDDDDDDDDDGKDNDKDSCSSDDILGNPDAQQGMNHNNGDDTGHGTLSEPFAAPQEDDRQLDKVSHAHESSSQVTAAPASISDGENNGLFEDEDDDDASNRADDGGDDSSDPDYQLESLGSFTDGAADSDATFAASGPVETRIPPPLEADDEDDMAVVELTVDQDEKLHSD